MTYPLPPEPDELGELTNDAIAGTFRITQRKRGHRYSLDDVITAWEAARTKPDAQRCLELGSGIGSVLLMLAYKLPHASFTAVEAQRNSFALLSRNVADNQLNERVRLLHGDLREVVQPGLGPFDLVTGTPPYVAPGLATPSSDSQKAYARQEYRGGVEAYMAAAARVLAADGRLVVCADARTPERIERSAEPLGLTVLTRRDVLPRAGKGALLSVFSLCRRAASSAAMQRLPDWIARDELGARTADYLAVRADFGMNRAVDEAPSP